MVPSWPKVIAGSLLPVELAFGAVVTPGSWRVEMRGVLVNAGVTGVPDAAAGCRTRVAGASTANTPAKTSLVRIKIPFVRE